MNGPYAQYRVLEVTIIVLFLSHILCGKFGDIKFA